MARVARLALRRWINRLLAGGFAARRASPSGEPDPRRRAVAGKRRLGLTVFVVFAAGLFSLQVLDQTLAILNRLRLDDPRWIGDGTADCLDRAGDEAIDPEDAAPAAVRACFERDLAGRGLSARQRLAHVESALARYRTQGSDGFREIDPLWGIWPQPNTWPASAAASTKLGGLAILLTIAVTLAALGAAEAQQLEHDLEWLLQTPAPAVALLGAKALEFCFLRPTAWIVGGAMFFTLARTHGLGAGALGVAVLAALEMGALAGSAELVLPLALRRVLSPATTRAWLGGFAMVGAVGLVLAMLLGQRITDWDPSPSRWLWLAPVAGLVAALDRPLPIVAHAAAAGAWIVLPPILAVLLAGRLIAGGLTVTSGERPHRPRRAPDGTALATGSTGESERPRHALARGVVGKDIRWLVRDRRALFQTFFVPVAIVGTQLVFNPRLGEGLALHPRWIGAASFGVAAYGLLFSASGIMAGEGASLWMLFTLPKPVHRVLIEKVTLWCVVGLAYFALVFAFLGARTPLAGNETVDFAVGAGGVVIFAFIASGFGALSTDPLAPPSASAGRLGITYLYLILAFLFGQSLAAESTWPKAVALAFDALLALALWQKVRDRIPYLLDPTARPPASLDVSDSILVVVAFFLLQVVAFLCLSELTTLSPAPQMCVAFAFAGAAVVLGATWVFRRLGVRDLLTDAGLSAPSSSRRLLTALAVSPLAGAALGAAAIAYRDFFLSSPSNRTPSVIDAIDARDAGWLVATAVVAAPLFEEIIFRGFMFRALRRGWPVWASALASAGAFAACHPPAAFVPVFVLGLAAAYLAEWASWVAAPMLLHMTYNAVVLSGVWSHLLGR